MNMSVRLLSPAKLTVELAVTGLREDGYHLIDAEMVALDYHDTIDIADGDYLEIEEAASGLSVQPGDDNLISKALRLAQKRAGVRVKKRIPAGAGLGGGSSNAATVLAWAGFDDEIVAASLGADVAFCLVGGRARVTGIGEVVRPLAFVERTFTLLTPPIGVSTPLVYKVWDEMGGPSGENGNDLEPAALRAFPELSRWRDALGDVAGVVPRLAGSGGTWFVEGEYQLELDGVVSVVAKTVRSGYGREKSGQTTRTDNPEG